MSKLIIKAGFIGTLMLSANSWGKALPVKLFKFEKSYNSQNIMVVQSQVDSDCHFAEFEEGDQKVLLNFYWLMNRQDFKETNSTIKQKIYEKLKMTSKSEDGSGFSLVFADLDKMVHDLPSGEFHISANRNDEGKCQVHVQIDLGPKNKNQTIQIDSIYSKVKTNFFRFPTGIDAIELRGKNIESGEKVVARFKAKP